MKLSELSRYWAAKELTQIEETGQGISFRAPFACPEFTVSLPKGAYGNPHIQREGKSQHLKKVASRKDLQARSWCEDSGQAMACFDLSKGRTSLVWQ